MPAENSTRRALFRSGPSAGNELQQSFGSAAVGALAMTQRVEGALREIELHAVKQPGLDRVHCAPAAQRSEDVVPGDGLRAHRAELTIETGPELLQAHPPTLTERKREGVEPA